MSAWNTIHLPDKLDPHIIHKSIVFILSQESTKMFFPRFEIQSDIHSNYAAPSHESWSHTVVVGTVADSFSAL